MCVFVRVHQKWNGVLYIRPWTRRQSNIRRKWERYSHLRLHIFHTKCVYTQGNKHDMGHHCEDNSKK